MGVTSHACAKFAIAIVWACERVRACGRVCWTQFKLRHEMSARATLRWTACVLESLSAAPRHVYDCLSANAET